MKKERTLISFECDECAKSTEELEQPTRPPYDSGWIYLHQLIFKITKDKEINLKDKHFCSEDCFISWLNRQIKERTIKQ